MPDGHPSWTAQPSLAGAADIRPGRGTRPRRAAIAALVALAGCAKAPHVRDVAELVSQPTPALPIATAAAAELFAAHVSEVTDGLRKAQRHAGFKGWRIAARRHGAARTSWEVRFRSVGFLPPYSCRVTFDQAGTLVASDGPPVLCEYQK